MKQVILVCSLFAAQIMIMPAFAAPAGSYTETCNNINARINLDRSSILTADCLNLAKRRVSAKLINYHTCKQGTIFNSNGKLKCQRK